VRARTLTVVVPLVLASAELAHPTWADGSIGEAVEAAGDLWLALHAVLLLGYLLLVAILWRLAGSRAARVLLLVFAASNSLFLGIDGLLVGILSRSNPAAADGVWNAPALSLLADVTGAAWAAALLLLALSLSPGSGRLVRAGCLVTWLAFVASAIPVPGTAVLGLAAALATGAWSVYQHGSDDFPLALLVFAAVQRQHVGPEAALGLVCVALALAVLAVRPADAATRSSYGR
jgi:hypothetical protein